jgi:hypothetical protein
LGGVEVGAAEDLSLPLTGGRRAAQID